MGYSTSFVGEFLLNKPLTPEHKKYLEEFNRTRRMQRNAELTAKLPDPVREAAGLPVGMEGGYYVGDTGDFGQAISDDVLDYNSPPAGQPGLWCQWVPNEDGTAIVWDGGEKFYDYVDWIKYLIEHFLKPWGYVLEGDMQWSGEEPMDLGVIRVMENRVTTHEGRIVYDGIDS